MIKRNFIEKYKMPFNLCDFFIKYHKNNKEYKRIGMFGNGQVDKEVKDSTDVLFFNESTDKNILKFFKYLSNYLREYMIKYQLTTSLRTEPTHLIQHYKKGGGYFNTHYEKGNLATVQRELVYMLYCNNVKKGGTYFPYQDIELECKKGDLILWPAYFTHPHKGVISKKQEKYIVTGWFKII